LHLVTHWDEMVLIESDWKQHESEPTLLPVVTGPSSVPASIHSISIIGMAGSVLVFLGVAIVILSVKKLQKSTGKQYLTQLWMQMDKFSIRQAIPLPRRFYSADGSQSTGNQSDHQHHQDVTSSECTVWLDASTLHSNHTSHDTWNTNKVTSSVTTTISNTTVTTATNNHLAVVTASNNFNNNNNNNNNDQCLMTRKPYNGLLDPTSPSLTTNGTTPDHHIVKTLVSLLNATDDRHDITMSNFSLPHQSNPFISSSSSIDDIAQRAIYFQQLVNAGIEHRTLQMAMVVQENREQQQQRQQQRHTLALYENFHREIWIKENDSISRAVMQEDSEWRTKLKDDLHILWQKNVKVSMYSFAIAIVIRLAPMCIYFRIIQLGQVMMI
jgi:hypothetical protein